MRVWDMDKFTLLDIAKLMGPVRCASYSPNAEWVAVGLGGKNAKHKLSGKWVVLDADTLDLRFEPPHTRFERVADIKFSPDSQWVAVGNADNGVDVYSVPGYGNTNSNFKRVAKFEGHSSFIAHLDWSEDSKKLQTNCGAHELLFWKLYDDAGKWKPRQEKSSSSMKDEIWETQTCIYGWHIRGIWCEGADGTDINACARNNTVGRQLIATSDDFGTVRLVCSPRGGLSHNTLRCAMRSLPLATTRSDPCSTVCVAMHLRGIAGKALPVPIDRALRGQQALWGTLEPCDECRLRRKRSVAGVDRWRGPSCLPMGAHH